MFYESYTITLHYFLGFINKVGVLFEFILGKFPEFLLRIFQSFFLRFPGRGVSHHPDILAVVNEPGSQWKEPWAYHRFCLTHLCSQFSRLFPDHHHHT